MLLLLFRFSFILTQHFYGQIILFVLFFSFHSSEYLLLILVALHLSFRLGLFYIYNKSFHFIEERNLRLRMYRIRTCVFCVIYFLKFGKNDSSNQMDEFYLLFC